MERIVDLLQKSCQEFGDKPALRVKVAGRWIDCSYHQLWSRSDRIAVALNSWGVLPGDRVAIFAPASPEWVAAYFGILKANSIVVPVDKELKYGELRHILADCGARLLFTTENHLDTVRECLDELPALTKIVLLHPPLTTKIRNLSQIDVVLNELLRDLQGVVSKYAIREGDKNLLLDKANALQNLLNPLSSGQGAEARQRRNLFGMEHSYDEQDLVESLVTFEKDGSPPFLIRSPHEAAVILYTSGTTGRSKGAMLSHANITSNINAVVNLFNLDSEMSTLSFLPINHVFEQVAGILLPLAVGGTVSFAESLKKLGDNLAEVKPNFLLGVPAVFRLLLERMQKNIQGNFFARTLHAFSLTRPLVARKVRATLGGSPTFVSGGAALDPVVAQGLMDLGIVVYQGYGITETSPVITVEHPAARLLGSVGPPIPNVEVLIHDPNPDGVGEIWVKGPNVMLGYFEKPQATAEVLTDGWYHTGDLGRLDSNGMLSICGRVKNVIVTSNGKNVYPEEVEEELLRSPYISEVMVYGHKLDSTAEEVYAIIYPNQAALDRFAQEHKVGTMTEKQVEDLIRTEVLKAGRNLADYKRIRKFTLREDEFPKTTTRKIKRFIVEARIATENQ